MKATVAGSTEDRLKILYISSVGERGGQEVVLLNILKSLDRARFTPWVLFLDEGPFVREVEEAGVAVSLIRAGRLRNVFRSARTVAQAASLIKREGIDLVHTLNSKAHVYGGLSAAVTSVPCLYHLQGVPGPSLSRDGVVSLLSFLAPAGSTVACSSYVADAFKRTWRSRRKVVVIHSGIEPVAATDDSLTVRDELGIPTSAPLVVMACRLQRWKGTHVFLEAAGRIAPIYPEARFMVVGGALFGLEEDFPEELHRQADQLGLGRAVVFTGYRHDVLRFLGAADLVIHSSVKPDPFPTVLLEAGMLGKAVVASDLGGPNEIVEDGVTGLLVPPNDAARLAQAVLDLLGSPDRRMRMGKAAGIRVRERFAAGRMARQFEEVYERLASRSSPHRS